MSRTNKIITIIFLSIPGIIISFILFFLLQSILIPDECKYHVENIPWFIELMYDFPSWNGCHPWPSNFQYGLIFICGIFLSFVTTNKLISKNRE